MEGGNKMMIMKINELHTHDSMLERWLIKIVCLKLKVCLLLMH